MFEDIFRYKKVSLKKLEDYGFIKIHGEYYYNIDILNGEFCLTIGIKDNDFPNTKLIEKSTGDEYFLYKTNASGKYVGAVREAVVKVVKDIVDKCYETKIFKAEQSVQIIEYVREKYGDELEYLWEKFPNNAVWRHKDSRKWYAVLLTVPLYKLGVQSDETAEIIDLRGKTESLENLIDNKRYYPGWHMNKKHWYTIILDGSVSLEQIYSKIDESYLLAK